MLSRFFMYTDDVHAHMYTHVSYERPHMTYSIRHRRDLLAEAFWHRLPRCSCKSMTHFTPPPALYFSTPYLCPRRVCQQYLSPNISLSVTRIMANGQRNVCFFFFFFFSQKRYEIPDWRESNDEPLNCWKQAMHTDHSLANKMSERPVSAYKRANQSSVRDDRAVGSDFSCARIKRKEWKAQVGDERYRFLWFTCSFVQSYVSDDQSHDLINESVLSFFIGVGRPKSKLNISRCLHVNNISSLFSSAALSLSLSHIPLPRPESLFPTSIKLDLRSISSGRDGTLYIS